MVTAFGAAPLAEYRRLERAINIARWLGAVLVFFLGPLFPNLGTPLVALLGGFLLAYAATVQRLIRHVQGIALQDRISKGLFIADTAAVVAAMLVFSPDSAWTTFFFGVLVIIIGAFRFAGSGALVSAATISLAYLGIAAFRQAAFGYALEIQRVATNVTVYLLVALLMSGVLREVRALRSQLEHGALYDELTQLPNRVLLADRVGRAVDVARRDGTSGALVFLGLERFKEVGQTLGYRVGDALLQRVGQRLRELLRDTDTAARVGGDEFAVLLPAVDDDAAVHVTSTLLQDLERHSFEVNGQPLSVEASAGITFYPEHGEDVGDLLRRAEVAMEQGKRSVSAYAVYAASGDEHSAERLTLLAEFRDAIDHGELLLHYQPLVRPRDGRVVAAEALARWQHPRRGLLTPDVFVPLVERTGLVRPFTEWVAAEALRQSRAWRDAGQELRIAVNVSVRNLLDSEFPETIARLLSASRIPPGSLVLEITESAIMANPARAADSLERLHRLGVGVAIDDFGTGYSSLAYLARLPVDEVKVDRSFVARLAVDESSAMIVRAIISLSHSLGHTVTAEGVEDQRTLDILIDLGCDRAQGFHFGAPMPPDELVGLLQRAASP